MKQTRVSDFSLLEPSVSSDPWAFYGLLHEQCPVYEMPETGAFVVTRYDDLRRVLKDTVTFSSDVRSASMGQFAGLHQSILRAGGGWEHVQTLQRTDPPIHTRYRRQLLNHQPNRSYIGNLEISQGITTDISIRILRDGANRTIGIKG